MFGLLFLNVFGAIGKKYVLAEICFTLVVIRILQKTSRKQEAKQ